MIKSNFGVQDNVSVQLIKGEPPKIKIAVCSDLHLEFDTLEIKNPGDVDVLILSGDICIARDLLEVNESEQYTRSYDYHIFFSKCASEFKHVIYVVGNHEHYNGDFVNTVNHLKKCLGDIKNLHILDKETFEYKDFVFVGSTLWTNMNNSDPVTLYTVGRMMSDFRCITNSNRQIMTIKNSIPRPAKFTPEDAVEEHNKCLEFIGKVCSEVPPWKTVIVVGHHTPSYQSCHPDYKFDHAVNGGYHSELSEFITSRPNIKLWTHGHTHNRFDYTIGECRVVCNARGYNGYEKIADSFELKVVEV